MSSSHSSSVTLTVQCVACQATKKVRQGEIPVGELPTCDRCGCMTYVRSAEES